MAGARTRGRIRGHRGCTRHDVITNIPIVCAQRPAATDRGTQIRRRRPRRLRTGVQAAAWRAHPRRHLRRHLHRRRPALVPASPVCRLHRRHPAHHRPPLAAGVHLPSLPTASHPHGLPILLGRWLVHPTRRSGQHRLWPWVHRHPWRLQLRWLPRVRRDAMGRVRPTERAPLHPQRAQPPSRRRRRQLP
jgi:hypothetical protein